MDDCTNRKKQVVNIMLTNRITSLSYSKYLDLGFSIPDESQSISNIWLHSNYFSSISSPPNKHNAQIKVQLRYA